MEQQALFGITLSVLLGWAAWSAFSLVQETKLTWATIPGELTKSRRNDNDNDGSFNSVDSISDLLDWIPRDNNSGTWTRVLSLRAVNRRTTDFYVAEGSFDVVPQPSIQPRQQWSNIVGERSLLINSVDAYWRVKDGINKVIAPGCNIEAIPEDPDDGEISTRKKRTFGDVSFHDCHGPLRSNAHVSVVANMVLVIWDESYGVRPKNYKQDFGELESALVTTLEKLFVYLRKSLNDDKAPDCIIVPAIATGNGAGSKHILYKVIAERILSDLQRSQYQSALPAKVIFQVWHQDETLSQSQVAIATALGMLHDKWNDDRAAVDANKRVVRLSNELGIALAIALSLVVASTSTSENRRMVLIRAAIQTNVVLLTVSSVLAALGMLQLLDAIVAPFGAVANEQSLIVLHVTLGAVSLFVAALVLNAKPVFESIVQPDGSSVVELTALTTVS